MGRYIVDAVPVPSQSIVNDKELGVSSATIRNEMARLEELGYITRPHPSAGSVPCDKGYRHYVESLPDIDLPSTEQLLIRHLFHQVGQELEEWLRLAATFMARSIQNVAVVTMPKPASCRFKYVELVALQDSLALAVLILEGAKVKRQLVVFDKIVSQPELTTIAVKLNAVYPGLTAAGIQAEAVELLPIEQQLTDCLVKMMRAEDELEYEEPYLDGLYLMLNQPEFASSERVLSFMELVEHRDLLRAIMSSGSDKAGVRVVIGKENEAEAIQDYSVVIGRYGVPEEAVGTVSIVGPTRLPYAHAIATVRYLSSLLSDLVAELYGREQPSPPA